MNESDKESVVVNVRDLESKAVQKYRHCPKHLTVVRHADLEDDSVFHCVPAGFVGPLNAPLQQEFIVPGQEVILVKDPYYGRFSIIRVLRKGDGKEYALVIAVIGRMGFLLEMRDIPQVVWGVSVDVL